MVAVTAHLAVIPGSRPLVVASRLPGVLGTPPLITGNNRPLEPGGFFPWVDKYVQGKNEVLRVYALDVDGERLTFFLRVPERDTPEHRTELESIVDSIDIQP